VENGGPPYFTYLFGVGFVMQHTTNWYVVEVAISVGLLFLSGVAIFRLTLNVAFGRSPFRGQRSRNFWIGPKQGSSLEQHDSDRTAHIYLPVSPVTIGACACRYAEKSESLAREIVKRLHGTIKPSNGSERAP
jgi:hypothetical protein